MNETLVKCVTIGAQVVIVIVCGVLIALGKDSTITDIFIAVCGSIAGTGVWNTLKGKIPAIQPRDITDAGDAEDASHTSH